MHYLSSTDKYGSVQATILVFNTRFVHHHNINLTYIKQIYITFLIIKYIQCSYNNLNSLHHLCSQQCNKQTPSSKKTTSIKLICCYFLEMFERAAYGHIRSEFYIILLSKQSQSCRWSIINLQSQCNLLHPAQKLG